MKTQPQVGNIHQNTTDTQGIDNRHYGTVWNVQHEQVHEEIVFFVRRDSNCHDIYQA